MRFLLLLFIIFNYFPKLHAQLVLPGSYGQVSRTYLTQDTTYWIGYFKDGYAMITKDGFVGLLDTSGKVIVEPRFDKIYPFEGNAAKVSLNMKYGLIDRNGIEILEPSMKYIGEFSKGVTYFIPEDFYKYGIINDEGVQISKPRYWKVTPFKLGFARFVRNDSIGVIDKEGNEILIYSIYDLYGKGGKQSYDLPKELLIFHDGLAITTKNNRGKQKYGFINTEGKVWVPIKYDEVSEFKNGFALARTGANWGVIDTNGKMIISQQYQMIHFGAPGYFVVSKNDKWGMVDFNNEQVIPFNYTQIRYLFDDIYSVTKDSLDIDDLRYTREWGAINIHGKEVLPQIYDGIGTANIAGNIIGTATTLLESYSLPTGTIRIRQYGKFILFDQNGVLNDQSYCFSWVISNYLMLYFDGGFSYSFSSPDSIFYLNLCDTLKNPIISGGLFGQPIFGDKVYLNINGETIKRINDTEKEPVHHYLDLVSIKDTSALRIEKHKQERKKYYTIDPESYFYGVINKSGDTLIPIMYEQIKLDSSSRNDFVPVRLNGKWGAVNHHNEVLIPFNYDSIYLTNSGAIARTGNHANEGNFALYDYHGKQLLPFIYSEIRELEEGVFIVNINRDSFIINARGEKVK